MTSNNTSTKRNPSWAIQDLCWKIQVPSPATKLILVFLGKMANASGRSYASYGFLKTSTNIKSDATISTALKFLRDGLGVLTWRQGGSGALGDSNKYVLNLSVMKKVVKEQGLFDAETGLLIRETTSRATSTIEDGATSTIEDGLSDSESESDFNDCKSDFNEPQKRLQPLKTNSLQSNSLQSNSLKDGAGELFEGVSARPCLRGTRDTSQEMAKPTPCPVRGCREFVDPCIFEQTESGKCYQHCYREGL